MLKRLLRAVVGAPEDLRQWGRSPVPWSAGLIVVTVAVLHFTYLEHPLHKLPLEDEILIPAKEVSLLHDLQAGLRAGEIPEVSPYSHCGRHLAGDAWSYWCVLNALVLFFPPPVVIVIKQFILQCVGGLAFYALVRRLTRNEWVATAFGLEYAFLVLGRFYVYNTHGYGMYLVLPLSCWAALRYLERRTTGSLLAMMFIVSQNIAVSYGHSVYTVPLSVFFFALVASVHLLERPLVSSIVEATATTTLALLGTAYYLVPLFVNLGSNTETARVAEAAGLIAVPTLDIDFPRDFLYAYLPSFFYPIWAQSIIPMLPSYGWGLLLCGLGALKPDASGKWVRGSLLAAAGLVLFSHVFYDALPRLVPSVARLSLGNIIRQLQVVHLFLLLACAAVLDAVMVRWRFWAAAGAYAALRVLAVTLSGRQVGGYAILDHLTLYDGMFVDVMFGCFLLSRLWAGRPPLPVLLVPCALLAVVAFGRAMLFEQRRIIGFPFSGENYPKDMGQRIYFHPERYDRFRRQTEFLDALLGADYRSFRTAFVTLPRDLDTVLFKELCNLSGRKEPFGYFESGSAYVNLINMAATGESFRTINVRNVTPERLHAALPYLRLMGVKYLFAWQRLSEPGLRTVGVWDPRWEPAIPTAKRTAILELAGQFAGSSSTGGLETLVDAYLGRLLHVYEVPDAAGIAFTADRAQVLERPAIFKAVFGAGRTPWMENTVLLEEPPHAVGAAAGGGAPAGVEIVRESYARVQIAADSDHATMLVLSLPYSREVRAEVDGRRARVYRAYGGFLAVELPAGRHTVVFTRVPYAVYAGLLLTALVYGATAWAHRRWAVAGMRGGGGPA